MGKARRRRRRKSYWYGVRVTAVENKLKLPCFSSSLSLVFFLDNGTDEINVMDSVGHTDLLFIIFFLIFPFP